ncbi:PdaC/SigV domain-containing protein [Paenibacillus sp. CF384]|uniref:PdaC/SigV domain-containing protein n=1 Tax=Paenibacillus sp. CF384 TaxID=1884382 RepID=UPI0008984C64|nr:DUF4163 domain-containing protein [Paenibacillus sp. CF384]SDW45475.1 Protein of unknown function [Paenibacillus sp. CF384]
MFNIQQPFKRITAIGAVSSLLLTLSAPLAFADQAVAPVTTQAEVSIQAGAVQLTSKTISDKNDYYESELTIPVISGMQDKNYQNTLNANLAARAHAELEKLKKQAKDDAAASVGVYEFRPYMFKVSYERITDGSTGAGGVLSFKMITSAYTGGAHGWTRIDTYNVRNEAKASAVKLKELFGEGYKTILNKVVNAEIAAHSDIYFPDTFKSIADNQPFYIKNGKAFLVFQQYEIAPYAAGIREIDAVIPGSKPAAAVPGNLSSLSLKIGGKTISGAHLFVGKNGIAMAPLRAISAQLGYALSWNAGWIDVDKGNQNVSLQVGKDNYATATAQVTLGAVPIMKDNTLYVPLSFFSKVLKVTVAYSKDAVVIG